MLNLYNDTVGESGVIRPWSKRRLYDEAACDVEALRVIRGAWAEVHRRDMESARRGQG